MRDVGLTFAGGGNRAFYQLGLLRRFGPLLYERLGAVAAVSAGACVAVIYFAEREQQTHHYWLERRRGVIKNFDWQALWSRRSPTPHAPIYRDTVVHAAEDGGLSRIRSLPFPLLVLCSGYSPRWPNALAGVLGAASYSLDRRLRPARQHTTLPRRLGFVPAVYDARDCTTPGELADLIIASSATPPFTPFGNVRGRTLLDGGLIDNAPAYLAEAVPGITKSVVLLTRPSAPAASPARLYLAPQRPVPVDAWDYTRPGRLAQAIRHGEHEALQHETALDAFVSSTP